MLKGKKDLFNYKNLLFWNDKKIDKEFNWGISSTKKERMDLAKYILMNIPHTYENEYLLDYIDLDIKLDDEVFENFAEEILYLLPNNFELTDEDILNWILYNENKEKNLLKFVKKNFNLNNKELSEILGVSEGSIRNSISTGKISKQMKNSLKLLIKVKQLENKLQDTERYRKKDPIAEIMEIQRGRGK